MSEEDNHNKREAKEAEAGEEQPAVRLFSFFFVDKMYFLHVLR